MSGISPQKPISIWQRPVQIDFRALTLAFGKGAAAGVLGEWADLASSGVDVLGALGIQYRTVEAIAWLLVQRSLLQAMIGLASTYQTSLNTQTPSVELLCNQLDYVIQASNLCITSDFFDHPKQLPLLAQVKESYRLWLRTNGLSEKQAEYLAQSLPRYFVYALNEQWESHPANYILLQDFFSSSPFKAANEYELAWQNYGEWLQGQVDKHIFSETFSLRQIYQPLRGYYAVKNNVEQSISGQDVEPLRYVVDLHIAITDWITQNDHKDTIRVICGGPGCGKSSFSRILAAHLSKTLPVLFIPLQHFNLSGNLIDSLNDFLRIDPDNILPPNPLEKNNSASRVILIFDGLDELSTPGKLPAQIAQEFVRELQRKLDRYNEEESRVFAFISSREAVIQTIRNEFQKEGQVFHILPYFLTEYERNKYNYTGNKDLILQDQRQNWWQTYGELKSRPYHGLPEKFNKEELDDITSQPLLNYLIALSHDIDQTELSSEVNLNTICSNLLDRIYKREWSNYQHPTIKGKIEYDIFLRILEEIAISCWHKSENITTTEDIENRFISSSMQNFMRIFEGGIEEGITRLVIAFYFRQAKGIDGTLALEFTHKSFREYLIARRIVRQLITIEDILARNHNSSNEKECLKQWILLCGITAIDEYLLGILRDEVNLYPSGQVKLWQKKTMYSDRVCTT